MAAFSHRLINDKIIENALHKTSEALYYIWVIDLATTDHEAIRVGYSGIQLGNITRASTRTERESIRLSIAFAAIASVVPAQWQLAAPGKINSSPRGDESYETIKFTRVFF